MVRLTQKNVLFIILPVSVLSAPASRQTKDALCLYCEILSVIQDLDSSQGIEILLNYTELLCILKE